MIELPDELDRLAPLVGMEWPRGNENEMWGLAQDWRIAAAGLRDVTSDVEEAKSASLAAYPSGDGHDAMVRAFDSLLHGDGSEMDQSLNKLADYFDQVGASAHGVGTEIEYTKLMYYSSLAMLVGEMAAAWIWPPTAPAVETAAVAMTRMAVRIIGERAVAAIIRQTGQAAESRIVKFLLRHVLLNTTLGTSQDAGIQQWQVQEGHRDKVNGDQVAVTVVGSAAGGAVAGPIGHRLSGMLGDEAKLWTRSLIHSGTGLVAAGAGLVAGDGTQLVLDGVEQGRGKAWDNVQNTHLDWRMISAGAGTGAASGLNRQRAEGVWTRRSPGLFSRDKFSQRINNLFGENTFPNSSSRGGPTSAGDGSDNGHGASAGSTNGHHAPDGGLKIGSRPVDTTVQPPVVDGTSAVRAGDASTNGHGAVDDVTTTGSAKGGVANGHGAVDDGTSARRAGDPNANGRRVVDDGATVARAADATEQSISGGTAGGHGGAANTGDQGASVRANGEASGQAVEGDSRARDENSLGASPQVAPGAHSTHEAPPDDRTSGQQQTDSTHQNVENASEGSVREQRPSDTPATSGTDRTTTPLHADSTRIHADSAHEGNISDHPAAVGSSDAKTRGLAEEAVAAAAAPPIVHGGGSAIARTHSGTETRSSTPGSTQPRMPSAGEGRPQSESPHSDARSQPVVDDRTPEVRAGASDDLASGTGSDADTNHTSADESRSNTGENRGVAEHHGGTGENGARAGAENGAGAGASELARNGEHGQPIVQARFGGPDVERQSGRDEQSEHEDPVSLVPLADIHVTDELRESRPVVRAGHTSGRSGTDHETDSWINEPGDKQHSEAHPNGTDANRGRCAELGLEYIKDHTGNESIQPFGREVGLDGVTAAEVQAAAGGGLRNFTDHDEVKQRLLDLGDGASALIVDEYRGPTDQYGVGAHAYVLTNEGGTIKVHDPGAGLDHGYPPRTARELGGTYAILFDAQGRPLHPRDPTNNLYRMPGSAPPLKKLWNMFRERVGPWVPSLNRTERLALFEYTSGGFGINSELRSGTAGSAVQERIDILDAALAKFPDYRRIVFRRAYDIPLAVLDKYRMGMVVSDNAYTSASKSDGRELSGNVVFKILSKTGKDISLYSETKSEREVIFERDKRFYVVSRTDDPNGYNSYIEMVEVATSHSDAIVRRLGRDNSTQAAHEYPPDTPARSFPRIGQAESTPDDTSTSHLRPDNPTTRPGGKTFATPEEAGIAPPSAEELAKARQLFDEAQGLRDAVSEEDWIEADLRFSDDTSGVEVDSDQANLQQPNTSQSEKPVGAVPGRSADPRSRIDEALQRESAAVNEAFDRDEERARRLHQRAMDRLDEGAQRAHQRAMDRLDEIARRMSEGLPENSAASEAPAGPATGAGAEFGARADRPSGPAQWAARMRAEQADWDAQMAAERVVWLRELADRERGGSRPGSAWEARMEVEQAEWDARMAAERADRLWEWAGGRPPAQGELAIRPREHVAPGAESVRPGEGAGQHGAGVGDHSRPIVEGVVHGPPQPGETRRLTVEVDGRREHVDLIAGGEGRWRVAALEPAPTVEGTVVKPGAEAPLDRPGAIRRLWKLFKVGFEGHAPKYPSGSGLDGDFQKEMAKDLSEFTHYDLLSHLQGNPIRTWKESVLIWRNRELILFFKYLTSRVATRAGEHIPIVQGDGDEYKYWIRDADPELRRQIENELRAAGLGHLVDESAPIHDGGLEHAGAAAEPCPELGTGNHEPVPDWVNDLADIMREHAQHAEVLRAAARQLLGIELGSDLTPETLHRVVAELEYQNARRAGAIAGMAESARNYNAENDWVPYSNTINYFDNNPMGRFLGEMARAHGGSVGLQDSRGVNNGGEPSREWGDLYYSDQTGEDEGRRRFFENALRRDEIRDERSTWAQILGEGLDGLGPHELADKINELAAGVRSRAGDIGEFASKVGEFLGIDAGDRVVRVDGEPSRLVIVDGQDNHEEVLARELANDQALALRVNRGEVQVEYHAALVDGAGRVHVIELDTPHVLHFSGEIEGDRYDATMVRNGDGEWHPVADPEPVHTPAPEPLGEKATPHSPEEIATARAELAHRLGIEGSGMLAPDRIVETIKELQLRNALRAAQIEALIDYARSSDDIELFYDLDNVRGDLAHRLGIDPVELTPKRLAAVIADPYTKKALHRQQVESLVDYAKKLRGLDAAAVDAARDQLARGLGLEPEDLYPKKYFKDEQAGELRYLPDEAGTDPKKLRGAIKDMLARTGDPAAIAELFMEYAEALDRIDPFTDGLRLDRTRDPRSADGELPVHDVGAPAHLRAFAGDGRLLADLLGAGDPVTGVPAVGKDWARVLGVELPEVDHANVGPASDEQTKADAQRWVKVYEVYRDGKIEKRERPTPEQLSQVHAEMRAEVRRRAADIEALSAVTDYHRVVAEQEAPQRQAKIAQLSNEWARGLAEREQARAALEVAQRGLPVNSGDLHVERRPEDPVGARTLDETLEDLRGQRREVGQQADRLRRVQALEDAARAYHDADQRLDRLNEALSEAVRRDMELAPEIPATEPDSGPPELPPGEGPEPRVEGSVSESDSAPESGVREPQAPVESRDWTSKEPEWKHEPTSKVRGSLTETAQQTSKPGDNADGEGEAPLKSAPQSSGDEKSPQSGLRRGRRQSESRTGAGSVRRPDTYPGSRIPHPPYRFQVDLPKYRSGVSFDPSSWLPSQLQPPVLPGPPGPGPGIPSPVGPPHAGGPGVPYGPGGKPPSAPDHPKQEMNSPACPVVPVPPDCRLPLLLFPLLPLLPLLLLPLLPALPAIPGFPFPQWPGTGAGSWGGSGDGLGVPDSSQVRGGSEGAEVNPSVGRGVPVPSDGGLRLLPDLPQLPAVAGFPFLRLPGAGSGSSGGVGDGHPGWPGVVLSDTGSGTGVGAGVPGVPLVPPFGSATAAGVENHRRLGGRRWRQGGGVGGAMQDRILVSPIGFGALAEFDPVTGELCEVAMAVGGVWGVYGDFGGVVVVFYRGVDGLGVRVGDQVIDLDDPAIGVVWSELGSESRFVVTTFGVVVGEFRYPVVAADADLGLLIRDVLSDPGRRDRIFTLS
ncbi:ADP-ribosyltransferase [Nocardia sp. CA-107356]|uniref:WXG100-like domain-containing protein n=1 Tax=Nocardia sp. CA-107356 TaxID=3239972 RepID=UPI003D8E372C